ncbi:MAG: ribonuclease Z [Methanomicrobiales archaeon]|nr:ribonuclease Z [Methanomicrobiales archaeon]
MAGETLQVYFLGTAGALPTPQKNPPCLMVRRGSDTLLFDCGEGAQQQMMRARTGFTIDALFITHWHADHFLGVPGLVQTLSFMERTEPLAIYGPAGVHDFVDTVKALSKNPVRFSLVPIELRHGSVVPFSGYRVTAVAAHHGTASLSYILREDPRPGRFNRERAVELGLSPGPLFGRLQRGEPVTFIKGGIETEIVPADVMGPPRPGRCLIYTGDTRPGAEGLLEYGADADLLVHDATFDDSAADRAREVFHSTASEAGEVARQIHARTLALVHISSRYTSTANHIREARQHFQGDVIAPDDCVMLEIPFREE